MRTNYRLRDVLFLIPQSAHCLLPDEPRGCFVRSLCRKCMKYLVLSTSIPVLHYSWSPWWNQGLFVPYLSPGITIGTGTWLRKTSKLGRPWTSTSLWFDAPSAPDRPAEAGTGKIIPHSQLRSKLANIRWLAVIRSSKTIDLLATVQSWLFRNLVPDQTSPLSYHCQL